MKYVIGIVLTAAVGAIIFIFIMGMITSQAVRPTAETVDAQGLLIRMIDTDAGVVCYQMVRDTRTLSCLPISQTLLEVGR